MLEAKDTMSHKDERESDWWTFRLLRESVKACTDLYSEDDEWNPNLSTNPTPLHSVRSSQKPLKD